MTKLTFGCLIYFLLLLNLFGQQDTTYFYTFDPNPNIADKAANIWSLGNYLYVANAYVQNSGGRAQQIFKIDASTREVVKSIALEGPYNDIGLSERGGYCITSDGYILVTGEWYSDSLNTTQMFLAKYDADLELQWINYFPGITSKNIWADAVAETTAGTYMVYYTQATSVNPPYTLTRVLATDTSGNLLFNKVVPDPFLYVRGYGSLVNTDDGHLLLSSWVYDIQNHPETPTNVIIHKIDNQGNALWNRFFNFSFYDDQQPMCAAVPGGGGAVMWCKDTAWYDLVTVDHNFNVMHGFDTNGNLLLETEWHEPGAWRSVGRLITAANNDLLGSGFVHPGAPGSRGRGWLFRSSPQGEVLWERYYSDSLLRPWSPQLEFIDMCEMEDGRIAATGIAYDKNEQGWIRSIVVIMVFDENGCLEPGCEQTQYYLTSGFEPLFSLPPLPVLYPRPNPAVSSFVVPLPDGFSSLKNDLTLAAYDDSGREVLRMRVADDQSTVHAGSWPAGVYQLVLLQGGKPMAGGKVVVKGK